LDFSANQVGRAYNVWVLRSYGVLGVWVKRGSTVPRGSDLTTCLLTILGLNIWIDSSGSSPHTKKIHSIGSVRGSSDNQGSYITL
ncbi:hypothetical protein BC835DRAFT_1292893, partial [Cytidiella melzeri]